MLIERALRERVIAVQSGPSDIGLFGATPQTFHSWSSDLSADFTIGGIAVSGTSATTVAAAQTVAPNPPTAPQAVMAANMTAEGSVHISGTAIALRMDGGSAAALDASTAPHILSIGSGTAPAIVQSASGTGAIRTEVPRDTESDIRDESLAVTSEAAVQHVTGGDAGQDIAAAIGFAQAAIAETRAQILAEIEQVTSAAAERIAAIQGELAGAIGEVGKSIADLATAADDMVLGIAAPVLDGLSDVPDQIGLAVQANVTAGIGTVLDLGDAGIGLQQTLALPADVTLDAALPIAGEDVAGGIATLATMVTEEAGFIVEDVTTGVAWPVAALAIDDSLTNRGESEGGDEADPASVLLGIAEGDGLLGGLAGHDDHDLGPWL